MSRVKVVPVNSNNSFGVTEQPLYFPFHLQVKRQTQRDLLFPVEDALNTEISVVNRNKLENELLVQDAAEQAQQILPIEVGVIQPDQIKPKIPPIGYTPNEVEPYSEVKPLPRGTTGEEFADDNRLHLIDPNKTSQTLRSQGVNVNPVAVDAYKKLSEEQKTQLRQKVRQIFHDVYKDIFGIEPSSTTLDQMVPGNVDLTQFLSYLQRFL